jgi:hypothetical protein
VLILLFSIVIVAYLVLSNFLPGAKSISTRKKIMLGGWAPPEEGVIHNRVPVRVEKVLKIIESYPKEGRPTLTHFVIKACG